MWNSGHLPTLLHTDCFQRARGQLSPCLLHSYFLNLVAPRGLLCLPHICCRRYVALPASGIGIKLFHLQQYFYAFCPVYYLFSKAIQKVYFLYVAFCSLSSPFHSTLLLFLFQSGAWIKFPPFKNFLSSQFLITSGLCLKCGENIYSHDWYFFFWSIFLRCYKT